MGFGERAYVGRAVVPATVEQTWAILVDLPQYAEWNPFTIEVRSTLQPGDPIVLRVDFGWLRLTQREQVREVVENERLAWGIATPVPWLLWAERVQTLTEVDGGCRYETVDRIGGLLGPLVHLLFGPSLRRGFVGVAESLAAYASRKTP